MQPKISVLISTYNNARFVAKKLEEIRKQSAFNQSEFLFIETGSPEKERELLKPFCDGTPNCKLITTDNRMTLYEAWNLGWKVAKAPLLCNTNMDDFMHPHLLETVVKEAEAIPWKLGSVLIAKQEMDEHWNSFAPEVIRKRAISPRPGPFTFWRKSVADEIGMFDGRFVSAGDKEFWSRALHHKLSHGLIPKILYLYTKAPTQLSKTNALDSPRQRDLAVLAEKNYPIIWPARFRWKILLIRLRRSLGQDHYWVDPGKSL